MAGSDQRSSLGVDRRASMRLSAQQTDDDDDYDLEAMGISNGFRPADTDDGSGRIHLASHPSPHNGRRTPPPRPTSTTKPRGLESFGLRYDGAMGPSVQGVSMSASNAAPTRSSSVSTDVPYMRAESPYRGPAGPSHPYQMYPQESRLARTASLATASTVLVPDRQYIGLGGPMHHYEMYPQNTVPEGDAVSAPTDAVPVGFPGLQNDYQRRLGPDGEEIADIIGPDGHTEQLPPYTQYPDEAFVRKTRPNVQVPITVPGAGGIGLATRNPEFASREDLQSPSRQSTRSIISDQSSHQVNMAALGASEKPGLKSWQQFARRRVCSIVPIWAIALATIVLVLFGIILGIVLAALKPKHPYRHQHPPEGAAESTTTTMTMTFDVTPMTTSPAWLPPLPTGTYELPISAPSIAAQGCLVNSAQSDAWSCNIPMISYTITISEIPNTSSDLRDKAVDLAQGNNTFPGWYAYGSQPPLLPSAQVLSLVIDSQDQSRGPAWSFELPYDKVVILEEDAFIAPGTKRDLDYRNNDHSPFSRKSVAEPGDKPWFCYWNGTLLEAFIYVNLTSSAGSREAAAPSSFTASSSAPTATDSQAQSTTSTYGSSAPTNFQSPGNTYSGSSPPYDFPPLFPKVMKIEDRRVPRGAQSVSPYCVQKIIDPNGIPQTYPNSTGHPTVIYLDELEPSNVSQIPGKRDIYGYLDPRVNALGERQTQNSCGCVWLWT